MKKSAIILGLFVVLLVFFIAIWQLGIFTGFGPCTTSAKDFKYVKPINPAELLLDTRGRLDGAFINTAPIKIVITEMIWETTSPKSSTSTHININLAGETARDVNPKSGEYLTIPPGVAFYLNVTEMNPSISGERHEPFTGYLKIIYKVEIDGVNKTRTEKGRITVCMF